MRKPDGYKPFEKSNYDKYSNLEEMVMSKIIIEHCSIEKNPNQYGIDLLIKNKDKTVGGIEVESHGKYWTDIFPFDTVHFLGRKTKFKDMDNYYLMTSAGFKNCVMINFNQLKDEYKTIQDNESCNNEPIYAIPKDQCIFGWDKVMIFLNNKFNNKAEGWM